MVYSLICTDFCADSICRAQLTWSMRRQKAQKALSHSLFLSYCLSDHVMSLLSRSPRSPLTCRPLMPLPATIKIKMSGLLKLKRFTLRGQKAFLSLFCAFCIHENRGQYAGQQNGQRTAPEWMWMRETELSCSEWGRSKGGAGVRCEAVAVGSGYFDVFSIFHRDDDDDDDAQCKGAGARSAVVGAQLVCVLGSAGGGGDGAGVSHINCSLVSCEEDIVVVVFLIRRNLDVCLWHLNVDWFCMACPPLRDSLCSYAPVLIVV